MGKQINTSKVYKMGIKIKPSDWEHCHEYYSAEPRPFLSVVVTTGGKGAKGMDDYVNSVHPLAHTEKSLQVKAKGTGMPCL